MGCPMEYDVYIQTCPTRLSQTLKKLERDGLVSRSVFATVPVTVEYAITPLGRTLTSTVAALTRWAEENIEAVLQAQQKYDRSA